MAKSTEEEERAAKAWFGTQGGIDVDYLLRMGIVTMPGILKMYRNRKRLGWL